MQERREFKVWDLFEISRPSARSQLDYEEWNVPFVASWNFDNWIIKYCEPKFDENLDKWNCITVSPVDWSSFYQECDFLWRGWAWSSIIILRNNNLNCKNWVFIASILQKRLVEIFSYWNMWNKDSIKNEKIKLPITPAWKPDRKYMENYMRDLEIKVKNRLKKMKESLWR